MQSKTLLSTLDGSCTVETYDEAKSIAEANPNNETFQTWIQVTKFIKAE
jgi:hypothetical protein